MDVGRVTTLAGYTSVAHRLALQAISVACDAAPHRPRAGERRWSMTRALPAARVLLEATAGADQQAMTLAAGDLVLTLEDPKGKVTDGFGHTRPVYRWLALHLLATAARLSGNTQAIEHLALAALHCVSSFDQAATTDPRLIAWRNLIAWQHGLPMKTIDAPHQSDGPAPLVALGFNDLIDAWTYSELIGLHALYLHATLRSDALAAARVQSAALYHLGHTQPDYTTYQPWALCAFASDPATATFAEQQLHDVATHLTLEGPGGAVLPALLLADASATMLGRASEAWRTG